MAEVILEGFLEKRGGFNTAWKRRYFVFESDGKVTYSTDKGQTTQGSFTIGVGWTVRVDKQEQHRHVFVLQPPTTTAQKKGSRAYYCAASSAAERGYWISAISTFLQSCAPTPATPTTSTSNKTQTTPTNTTNATNPANTGSSSNSNQNPPTTASTKAPNSTNSTTVTNSTSNPTPIPTTSNPANNASPTTTSTANFSNSNPTTTTTKTTTPKINPTKPTSHSNPPRLSLLGQKTAQNANQKLAKHHQGYAIALAIVCVLHLCAGAGIFCWLEGWKFLDSFYFCYVTLTTIGYGDLTPTTKLSQQILTLYALIGLGLLAQAVSTLQQRAAHSVLVELGEKQNENLLRSGEGGGGSVGWYDVWWRAQKRLIFAVFAYILVICLGAPLFMWLEGWNFVDSLYFCTITLTTIGYGDLAPTNATSKCVMMCYSLLGMAAVAEVISVIQQKVSGAVFVRLISLGDELSDGKPAKQKRSWVAPTLTILLALALVAIGSTILCILHDINVRTAITTNSTLPSAAHSYQHWTVVEVDNMRWTDALYFSVVTFTTIGYGDITPTRSNAKIFLTLYALILLGVMGLAVQAIQSLLSSAAAATESVWETQKEMQASRFLPATRKLMVAVLFVILHFLVGAGVFGWLEGWDFSHSIYWAVVTTSTIGYGDITPLTTTGKLVFVPFSLVGIGLLGFVIGIIGERERQRLEQFQAIAATELDEIDL